jgi:hypothetical protein
MADSHDFTGIAGTVVSVVPNFRFIWSFIVIKSFNCSLVAFYCCALITNDVNQITTNDISHDNCNRLLTTFSNPVQKLIRS